MAKVAFKSRSPVDSKGIDRPAVPAAHAPVAPPAATDPADAAGPGWYDSTLDLLRGLWMDDQNDPRSLDAWIEAMEKNLADVPPADAAPV